MGSQFLQNTEIIKQTDVSLWKIWRIYGSVSYLLSCIVIAEFRWFSVGFQFKFLKNSAIICKILTREILEDFKRWFSINFGKIISDWQFNHLKPHFLFHSRFSSHHGYHPNHFLSCFDNPTNSECRQVNSMNFQSNFKMNNSFVESKPPKFRGSPNFVYFFFNTETPHRPKRWGGQ